MFHNFTPPFFLLQITTPPQKNPPPDFTTGYQYPITINPPPRAELFTRIDMAMLAILMLMTAYFILYKRSRKEVRLISLFSLLYFGFYRKGCVCSVGSLQNVAMAIFHRGYALPLSVGVFFILPLLFALFFGRVFCSAVCPLGAAQDLILQKAKRVPTWLDEMLSLIPYVYLGLGTLFAAAGTVFIICEYDPFVAFFRLSGGAMMVTFGVIILFLSTFIGRPYCRYLCPYGVLLRWAAAWSKWKVHVAPDKCVKCHLCAESCPFGAMRMPVPEDVRPSRKSTRMALSRVLWLIPLFAILSGAMGRLASPLLSHVDITVQTADRVWKERHGIVKGETLESQAHRANQVPDDILYAKAAKIRRTYALYTTIFGVWLGLVLGLKLFFLTTRRKWDEYDADPAACVACGRCFGYCPSEADGKNAAEKVYIQGNLP